MYSHPGKKILGEKQSVSSSLERKIYIIVFPLCSLLFMSELLSATFHLILCLSDLHLLIHSDGTAKVVFIKSPSHHLHCPL